MRVYVFLQRQAITLVCCGTDCYLDGPAYQKILAHKQCFIKTKYVVACPPMSRCCVYATLHRNFTQLHEQKSIETQLNDKETSYITPLRQVGRHIPPRLRLRQDRDVRTTKLFALAGPHVAAVIKLQRIREVETARERLTEYYVCS